PVNDYEKWLNQRMNVGRIGRSCFTGKRIYVPNYAIFKTLPDERVAGLDSLEALSKIEIEVNEGDGLKETSEKAQEIAYYIVEFVEGENLDVVDSSLYQNLAHSYKTIDCWNGKYIAYDFFCDKSEFIFGCYRVFSSKFCIHCYNSKNLTRCFEMESCYNCSDSMFCHNCENVRDSLFCSNVKNKRYAVLNQEVGQGEFLRIKKMLVGSVSENLEWKKSFAPDIFSVGCKPSP
ncbi:MAG: hypothetical protein V1909_01480, partial [Candidatus Micrarchaeota archaeon]